MSQSDLWFDVVKGADEVAAHLETLKLPRESEKDVNFLRLKYVASGENGGKIICFVHKADISEGMQKPTNVCFYQKEFTLTRSRYFSNL